jgi:hypothetical protein
MFRLFLLFAAFIAVTIAVAEGLNIQGHEQQLKTRAEAHDGRSYMVSNLLKQKKITKSEDEDEPDKTTSRKRRKKTKQTDGKKLNNIIEKEMPFQIVDLFTNERHKKSSWVNFNRDFNDYGTSVKEAMRKECLRASMDDAVFRITDAVFKAFDKTNLLKQQCLYYDYTTNDGDYTMNPYDQYSYYDQKLFLENRYKWEKDRFRLPTLACDVKRVNPREFMGGLLECTLCAVGVLVDEEKHAGNAMLHSELRKKLYNIQQSYLEMYNCETSVRCDVWHTRKYPSDKQAVRGTNCRMENMENKCKLPLVREWNRGEARRKKNDLQSVLNVNPVETNLLQVSTTGHKRHLKDKMSGRPMLQSEKKREIWGFHKVENKWK